MQKSLLIKNNTTVLDSYLSDGWEVVSVTPMAVAVTGQNMNTEYGKALVIIKEINKK